MYGIRLTRVGKRLGGVCVAAGMAVSLIAGCSLFSDPYEDNLAKGMKTPETSKLFVKYVDPLSGVVSYLLKPGLIDENQQSLYFTCKSMTDDGRFLVLDVSCNEYRADGTRKDRKELKYGGKHKAIVDLLHDSFTRLDDIDGQIPFLDVKTDQLFYARFSRTDKSVNALYRRDLLVDPTKEIRVCSMPEELVKDAKLVRYFTHLTLSHDRKYAYLDSRVDDNHVQGVLEIATGKYTKWGETGFININHGQINPVRNDISLNAWECVKWKDSKGVEHGIERVNGVYPRLQLIGPGWREMVPPASTYATHERWNEEGDGFYWCAASVWYCDLKTREQRRLSPRGAHAMCSKGMEFLVTDCPVANWYRGCRWQVYFHDITTDRGVFIFTYRPPMCEKENESKLHPDPHPQLVCNDRYAICTINHADGHMDFAVTPVAQLLERTRTNRMAAFSDLPASACPKAIGGKLSEHFLETPPDKYGPKGCERPFKGDMVPYSVASLWINAMQYARTVGNRELEQRLVKEFEPFYDGGAKAKMRSEPFHVDFTIFGAIPLQVYLLTGDERARKLGMMYAETQWRMPTDEEIHRLPKWVWGGKEQHILPKDEVKKFHSQGYSPQTRLWIDDMYMITVLQTQAYRAMKLCETNRPWAAGKYLDRAAFEMCLYLDRLQLKEGPHAGLFYHAPDVPYVWGRGDGWMAAGMAMLLRYLPANNLHYHKILAGYHRMMAALLKTQREDGLWAQLVGDSEAWSETSGSAMFTYAFIEGVKNGWLCPREYGPAARKAWIALTSKLDEYGNIPDVCIGTGKFNDRQYYLDRKRLVGDPHGQAPLLWCVNALLTPAKVEETK